MKPTFSFFNHAGGEGLGEIFNENNQINIKFLDAFIPFSDTTGRTSINALGKSRLITVQGSHDGTGFTGANPEAQIKSFIDKMELWINASMQTSESYTDSFNQTYAVDCVDWSWKRSNNDPFRIIYSLIMMEC